MKMTESGKIILVSCIIDFNDVQISLRRFGLNVNAFRFMMAFLKIWPDNSKKAFITLQAFTFRPKRLNETCTSLKSIMQLTRTIFPDSAIFIEKKLLEWSCMGKK